MFFLIFFICFVFFREGVVWFFRGVVSVLKRVFFILFGISFFRFYWCGLVLVEKVDLESFWLVFVLGRV